eukprot:TRINITY_DN26872_c0_g1_i1.p1 TRINITY_DN26872_c0_g1~~TRINITY_DN26872_c0_g1_i1.p1  ORF type:complete len:148 (+),score=16.18 TRINITY_DN26872_c0_g1_i1:46-489(+)
MDKLSTVLSVILTLNLLQGSHATNTTVLTKITTVTGSGGDCGMLLAFGWITVELIGNNKETCSTHTLDNSGDDMNPGQTDEYTGEILGSCRTTEFSDGLFQFVMHHHGFDGWCMHSVSLTFNTGEVLDCVADVELDNDQGYRCPGHN